MEDLFESLESHCIKHLQDINNYVEKYDEFKCPQMIDDMMDLIHSIKDMHQILNMSKKTL